MVSKRHVKARLAWQKTRGHVGKQIHATEAEAIAHAQSLRKSFAARVHVYRCGEGRTDRNEPRHWHVGH